MKKLDDQLQKSIDEWAEAERKTEIKFCISLTLIIIAYLLSLTL